MCLTKFLLDSCLTAASSDKFNIYSDDVLIQTFNCNTFSSPDLCGVTNVGDQIIYYTSPPFSHTANSISI